MPWDAQGWNLGRREFYKTLIRLRRTSAALRWGGFQLIYAADESIAFLREAPEERLLIVARRKDDSLTSLPVRHAGLADGIHLHDILTGCKSVVSKGLLPLHNLPAVGTQIWQVE